MISKQLRFCYDIGGNTSVKVIGIVLDNWPMYEYVFLIDIPFKGSQSLAKLTSKVTAESYLHSGVNDSAMHVTAESMTTL
jgi:hypothetical protein